MKSHNFRTYVCKHAAKGSQSAQISSDKTDDVTMRCKYVPAANISNFSRAKECTFRSNRKRYIYIYILYFCIHIYNYYRLNKALATQWQPRDTQINTSNAIKIGKRYAKADLLPSLLPTQPLSLSLSHSLFAYCILHTVCGTHVHKIAGS